MIERFARASLTAQLGDDARTADQHSEARAWDSPGYAHYRLGRNTEAVSSYQPSLNLFRQLGDRFNEAEILDHLGDAYQADGKAKVALANWRHAMAIMAELGLPGAVQIRVKLQRLTTSAAS